jgi:hypothetical protein
MVEVRGEGRAVMVEVPEATMLKCSAQVDSKLVRVQRTINGKSLARDGEKR